METRAARLGVREERRTSSPTALGSELVFHYSIPVFDIVGDGALESALEIGSDKLVITGGEILISKLNPRIPRILSGVRHGVPTVASTEFIALRPGSAVDERFLRYLLSGSAVTQYLDGATMSVTRSQQRVRPDVLTKMWLRFPDLDSQREIADYLDIETARIDTLIARKRELVECLNERIDQQLLCAVGSSEIANGQDSARPLSRMLDQTSRRAESDEMVTAYRDGTVTLRRNRRAEGYTESWTENSRVKGVNVGDVVVHGLDGFAGAIGTSDSTDVCSPVYHVLEPSDGGDPLFYGRLLRLLATSGYLELFATSTRERAVDFRNWDLFGSIPIPVVPIDRQRSVGCQIEQATNLHNAVERSVLLARERRQALITAAVTGELDIPGASD